METPIKMDDLGVPLFLETPIIYTPLYTYTKENNALRDSVFYISLSRNFKEC